MLGLGMAAPGLAQQRDCPEPQSWQRENLDAAFVRERRFAGLATPMRSSGRVQSEGDAIVWRTEAPIEMVLRIDAGGISQSVAGGPMQPLAGSARGNAVAASLIAPLLSGDLAGAAADFAIEQRQDPASGDWHVTFEPKAAMLARAIERIEMTGCEGVEVVVIDQPNGDQDRVVFGAAE
jgi:hypothetical protein